MGYILYGEKELNHLKNVDKKLEKAILKFGFIQRRTNNNLYDSLIESIIGQQISTKAATTVKNKLKSFVSEIEPKTILNFSDKELQSCGLSFRKVDYIKNISKAFINNEINFDKLNKLTDQEITKVLTKLKGIGPWTAQMVLIHTFKRPNVMTYLDLGLKNGLKLLHNLKDIDEKHFNHYKKLYSPYATVASIYLWKVYSNSTK